MPRRSARVKKLEEEAAAAAATAAAATNKKTKKKRKASTTTSTPTPRTSPSKKKKKKKTAVGPTKTTKISKLSSPSPTKKTSLTKLGHAVTETEIKGGIDVDNNGEGLGVIDPDLDIEGTIHTIHDDDGGGAPCDVMLALVDPDKNMDKFFILQLIDVKDREEGMHDDAFVVYTRWGRTGTKGQALQQDFRSLKDAMKTFQTKFRQKTGLSWKDRHDMSVPGKYRFMIQDFHSKRRGYEHTAQWQYWVDDGVDGKRVGWYDYTTDGSARVEQLYSEMIHSSGDNNKDAVATRIVTSGHFTYRVDLQRMTQTNITHHTTRQIRRVAHDDEEEEEAVEVDTEEDKKPAAKPTNEYKAYTYREIALNSDQQQRGVDLVQPLARILQRRGAIFSDCTTKDEWDAFEQDFGVVLPADYKALCNTVGTCGYWLNGRISLNGPRKLQEMVQANQTNYTSWQLRGKAHQQVSLWKDQPAFHMEWGHDISGSALSYHWICAPSDDAAAAAAGWPVVMMELEAPMRHNGLVYPCTVTELLYRAAVGLQEMDAFEEEDDEDDDEDGDDGYKKIMVEDRCVYQFPKDNTGDSENAQPSTSRNLGDVDSAQDKADMKRVEGELQCIDGATMKQWCKEMAPLVVPPNGNDPDEEPKTGTKREPKSAPAPTPPPAPADSAVPESAVVARTARTYREVALSPEVQQRGLDLVEPLARILKRRGGGIRFVDCTTDEQWEAFENEMGIQLPADYKKLCNTVGTTGVWLNGRISLNNPAQMKGTYETNLEDYTSWQLEGDAHKTVSIWKGQPAFHLEWGGDCDGSALSYYWVCAAADGGDGTAWPVVLMELEAPLRHNGSIYPCTVTEFLYRGVVGTDEMREFSNDEEEEYDDEFYKKVKIDGRFVYQFQPDDDGVENEDISDIGRIGSAQDKKDMGLLEGALDCIDSEGSNIQEIAPLVVPQS